MVIIIVSKLICIKRKEWPGSDLNAIFPKSGLVNFAVCFRSILGKSYSLRHAESLRVLFLWMRIQIFVPFADNCGLAGVDLKPSWGSVYCWWDLGEDMLLILESQSCGHQPTLHMVAFWGFHSHVSLAASSSHHCRTVICPAWPRSCGVVFVCAQVEAENSLPTVLSLYQSVLGGPGGLGIDQRSLYLVSSHSSTGTSFPDVEAESFPCTASRRYDMTLWLWITVGHNEEGRKWVEMICSCWKNWGRKMMQRSWPGRGQAWSRLLDCRTGSHIWSSSMNPQARFLFLKGRWYSRSLNHISVRKQRGTS